MVYKTKSRPDLEHSKQQALTKLRELSKLYTKPSENPNEPPYHKYTLRGVSTEPCTTYVLANPMGAGDLMSTDESEWQWWKLQYSRGDARPVSCTVCLRPSPLLVVILSHLGVLACLEAYPNCIAESSRGGGSQSSKGRVKESPACVRERESCVVRI